MILMFSNLLSLSLPLINSRHRNPHTQDTLTQIFIVNDRQEIEFLILVFPEKKFVTNLLNLFLFIRDKVASLLRLLRLLRCFLGFIALYFSWLFASYA
jgi:hypothetical protein